MDAVKIFLKDQAQVIWKEAWKIAREIGENPELGYQEYYACEILTQFLSRHGFEIHCPVANLETAFVAKFKGNRPGPRIAYLAEYDALPEVGHGCGHNLIGAASAGAAVTLSKSLEIPGEILVIGSPAEETSGAKVTLVEHGIFENIDVAMMFHPGSQNVPIVSTLALDAIEFVFLGRSAHSVSANNYGINALDALIEFFNKVNELKSHLSEDESINGIITEGGVAPNIIPERAVARFYIRARKRKNLDNLTRKVIRCAKEAAFTFSAKLQWHRFESSYDEMVTNRSLAEVFASNLRALGVRYIAPPQNAMGSVDMGNVSRVVPAIHPYLAMGYGMDIPHTRDFAKATLSKSGERLLLLAIRTLALTGWDVLTNEQLLKRIKKEFRRV